MNNLVQELIDLNPADWTRVLEHDYKIKITRDGDVASLRYDQIESPMSEPIVQQCRGMVVDTARRQVVAWPYNKFWNHGEHLAAPVDWSTARVQEKLDGSLMILYWHHKNWHVASSGHPTAGGSFGTDERTFRDAFWQLARDGGLFSKGYGNPYTAYTYMFELCDTPNRVVVRHEAPRLVLHGARFLGNGAELTRTELVAVAEDMRCDLVHEFPISSIEECLAAAEALDPIQQEGFVVVDAEFRRVKIKSPRYVILHHMKGEATVRRAVELWQTGEAGELLAHFPEMRDVIQPVHDALDSIAAQAAWDFEANKGCPSRKEFALVVKDRPWAVVLFRMLSDGHTLEDAKAIMRRQTTSTLERMISP